MLAFFPECYDDELLFSILGRYHLMSGNRSYRSTLTDLYGFDTVRGVVELPSHLRRLCDNVPKEVFKSPFVVVERHTLFPYYDPFLADDTARSVLESMIGDDGNRIRTQSGIVAGSVSTPAYLRFCPQCKFEDEQRWGHAYWHRIHQIPGVLICPNHVVWLQNSTTHYNLRTSIQKYEILSICSTSSTISESIELNTHLIFIANQSQWLLSHKVSRHSLNRLRSFYVQRLYSLGYVTEHGTIRFRKLIPAFVGFFGNELLNIMHSDISAGDQDTWLHKVLRKPRVSCHPLRHILLLEFVGESTSSLFHSIQRDNVTTTVNIVKRARWQSLEDMKHTSREVLQSKRTEWSKHVVSLPTASRTELRRFWPSLYSWLYRNDRLWLMENMPRPMRQRYRNNRVDWKQRDLEIASEISEAIAHIKSNAPPVRVSVSRVGKEIGRLSLLEHHLDKLPRCRELLEKSTETIEAFRMRRVHFTAQDLREKSEEMVKWKLERLAGLRPDYGPAVEHCIIQELAMGDGGMHQC